MPKREKGVCPQHLRDYRWKSGQSGNPNGRRRQSFQGIVADILDEYLPAPVDMTKREALARVFVDELLKANGHLIREFLNREWPVAQVIDATVTARPVPEIQDSHERMRQVAVALRDAGVLDDPELALPEQAYHPVKQ